MNKIKICIAGVYSSSEGYPNVKYRLQSLKADSRYQIQEINCLSDDWGGNLSLIKIVKFILAHAKLAYKLYKSNIKKNFDCVYIPYPSILSAIIVRKFLKHQTIFIDAFISIYDTAVIDRRIVSKHLGKFILKLEKLSFCCANYIFVDSEMNASYYARLFNINREKIISTPLLTNESIDITSGIQKKFSSFRVLFVGSMVPLHGIEVIANAIVKLRKIKEIEFRIIGDGQQSKIMQQIVQNKNCNLSWTKKWLKEEEVCKEISAADICLGIFSNNSKAQRVCPYKLYLYSFHEKAIITGNTLWAQSIPEDVFKITPLNNPEELANAIIELYHSDFLRESLGKNAKRFYDAVLSNRIADEIFYNTIIRAKDGHRNQQP